MIVSRRKGTVRRIGTAVVTAALAAGGAAAGDTRYVLKDVLSIGDAAARPQKILVVAIAEDPEVRNRFEDKFVSHLKGRDVGATASHSIVPSLTALEDREKVLGAIEAAGVDGVMTVRAVPLDKLDEEGWVEQWRDWLSAEATVRQLIETSLPVPPKKAKRYGIEFALWGTTPGRRLWAARTGTCMRKDLEAGVADLLQLAIDGLKDARWL
jgi:hypothetical protein